MVLSDAKKNLGNKYDPANLFLVDTFSYYNWFEEWRIGWYDKKKW